MTLLVVLLYPDISNFTFQNVKISKCKNVLIDFLNELGNFKQKNFYTSKCRFFLHFTTTDPIYIQCPPCCLCAHPTNVAGSFAGTETLQRADLNVPATLCKYICSKYYGFFPKFHVTRSHHKQIKVLVDIHSKMFFILTVFEVHKYC